MTIDKMMMMMMTGGKNRNGKGAALKVRTHRRLPRRERWKHKLSLLYLEAISSESLSLNNVIHNTNCNLAKSISIPQANQLLIINL